MSFKECRSIWGGYKWVSKTLNRFTNAWEDFAKCWTWLDLCWRSIGVKRPIIHLKYDSQNMPMGPSRVFKQLLVCITRDGQLTCLIHGIVRKPRSYWQQEWRDCEAWINSEFGRKWINFWSNTYSCEEEKSEFGSRTNVWCWRDRCVLRQIIAQSFKAILPVCKKILGLRSRVEFPWRSTVIWPSSLVTLTAKHCCAFEKTARCVNDPIVMPQTIAHY